MRKRVWVCTWFTCDGKARDGVKTGKDRDLSALDAPAEPAGTAEGPSFTARALSWVLLVVFLLLVHVLQGWSPPACRAVRCSRPPRNWPPPPPCSPCVVGTNKSGG